MTQRKPSSIKPYTTGQIARELGVNRSTAIAMLVRGDVPWYWSKGHGRRLVLAKDWNAWVRANAGRDSS